MPAEAFAHQAGFVVGSGLVLVGVLIGVWVTASTPDVDLWWNSMLAGRGSPVLYSFGRVMDWLGGGWFAVLALPVTWAAILLIRDRARPGARRYGRAGYLLASLALSALIVQLMKDVFGRNRPEDILVISDYGSYPSGHVANAATIAVVAAVLLPRVWVYLAGAAWVLLMAFSRTAVHAHWLSDTVGGALIGAGTAVLLAAACASFIRPGPALPG